MKYSIIVPTNNDKLIGKNLEYIKNLKKPNEEYEVLVIQNGNNQRVKPVVESYFSSIPNLKYFNEEKIGLVYSRHRGAKEAKGEILCYLDDDSFVDKKYLIAIESTFANEEVLLAGGNNIPLFESKPPKWLKFFWVDSLYGKYLCELSLIQFKQRNMRIPTWYVFGCNFAIRKDALYKYNGFNPDGVPFDLVRYRGDGETALSLKLNYDGKCAYFNPDILIHHYVPNSRLTVEYFKKRGFCAGVSESFSEIRKAHGFEYYDWKTNNSITDFKVSFVEKICKKVKVKFSKLAFKFLPEYNDFIAIKEEYKKSYREGFEFHQSEVKRDVELLSWVLKPEYIKKGI